MWCIESRRGIGLILEDGRVSCVCLGAIIVVVSLSLYTTVRGNKAYQDLDGDWESEIV